MNLSSLQSNVSNMQPSIFIHFPYHSRQVSLFQMSYNIIKHNPLINQLVLFTSHLK
jgi:hypothetical protein